MNVSDFAGGTGTPERDGPVDDAPAADATTSQPPASRRGRRVGLIAAAIGVLGAAVWFVGRSLVVERCIVDGVEVPCDEVETRVAEVGNRCFADSAMTVEVPCEEGTDRLDRSCILNGVEVPCEEVEALEGKCFADEALTVEIPCEGPATIEAPPLEDGLTERCFVNDFEVPCGGTYGLIENPFLEAGHRDGTGFPLTELESARTVYDEVVSSVFAVGPVMGGLPDAASATGTAWAIHPRFAITNQHIIEGIESTPLALQTDGATEVQLYLHPDMQSVKGRVVAVDASLDAAVIEFLEPVDVPPLTVAGRPPAVGEPVLYVGHPARMESRWVSGVGVITGYSTGQSTPEVFSSLPSHSGASGSPILDLNGEVVSLLSGSLQPACPLREARCIADASVQYVSLPTGPLTTRGIDGATLRRFFTAATGETLPPGANDGRPSGQRTAAPRTSLDWFAEHRERDAALESSSTETVSGFPVAERATVAALYEQVAAAVFIVESPDGAPQGTAWLAGPTTVVTNEHVSTFTRSGDIVMLRQRDGSSVRARIIEDSVPDDLTIMRLDAPLSARPLPIAEENVDVGVPVFYIGHPGWMEQFWITGLGVTTGYDTKHRNRMLTTVPAEAGGSGSPILNLDGEVVAIMSFVTSGTIPAGGYPVADRDDLFFSVPVSPGSGGVDASTLRAYVERHLD